MKTWSKIKQEIRDHYLNPDQAKSRKLGMNIIKKLVHLWRPLYKKMGLAAESVCVCVWEREREINMKKLLEQLDFPISY
jgi:hypothetical protein